LLLLIRVKKETAMEQQGKKYYLHLNDIEAYKTAFKLSNYVWNPVVLWDRFSKDTVGGQFIRAIDSVSANIAEGFGRYHKKDKIKFYRYSMASLKESFDWNEKSKVRKLYKGDEYDHIINELQKLPYLINRLIYYTDKTLHD
jgi:four helix bundle protein